MKSRLTAEAGGGRGLGQDSRLGRGAAVHEGTARELGSGLRALGLVSS